MTRSGVHAASLILYDGVCGLCNRIVRFVLKRDHKDVFRFASLQSSVAQSVLARHGITPDVLDTVYVVLDFGQPCERVLSRSAAALEAASRLGGLGKAAAALKVVPEAVLDAVYDVIARHRYRMFGRYETCPLPDPHDRGRFIDMD